MFFLPVARETLIPLTSSLYIPGTINSVKSVLVDIGTGYYAEKDLESSIKFCDVRCFYAIYFMICVVNLRLCLGLCAIAMELICVIFSAYPAFYFPTTRFFSLPLQSKIEHVSKNIETVQNAVNNKREDVAKIRAALQRVVETYNLKAREEAARVASN